MVAAAGRADRVRSAAPVLVAPVAWAVLVCTETSARPWKDCRAGRRTARRSRRATSSKRTRAVALTLSSLRFNVTKTIHRSARHNRGSNPIPNATPSLEPTTRAFKAAAVARWVGFSPAASSFAAPPGAPSVTWAQAIPTGTAIAGSARSSVLRSRCPPSTSVTRLSPRTPALPDQSRRSRQKGRFAQRFPASACLCELRAYGGQSKGA